MHPVTATGMVVKNKAFQGTGTDLAIFTQAQGAVEHPSHKGESKSQHQAKVDDQLCAVMQNIISHFIRQNGLNFLRGCAPEQVVVETMLSMRTPTNRLVNRSPNQEPNVRVARL